MTPRLPYVPKKIPRWVWWFYFISVSIFVGVMLSYAFEKMKEQEAKDQAILARDKRELEQKAKRAKAEELAAEGFAMLAQQRRNQLYSYCREQGNIPMLFLDKVVCVNSAAIAWEKYDADPAQDTTGDNAP